MTAATERPRPFDRCIHLELQFGNECAEQPIDTPPLLFWPESALRRRTPRCRAFGVSSSSFLGGRPLALLDLKCSTFGGSVEIKRKKERGLGLPEPSTNPIRRESSICTAQS